MQRQQPQQRSGGGEDERTERQDETGEAVPGDLDLIRQPRDGRPVRPAGTARRGGSQGPVDRVPHETVAQRLRQTGQLGEHAPDHRGPEQHGHQRDREPEQPLARVTGEESLVDGPGDTVPYEERLPGLGQRPEGEPHQDPGAAGEEPSGVRCQAPHRPGPVVRFARVRGRGAARHRRAPSGAGRWVAPSGGACPAPAGPAAKTAR